MDLLINPFVLYAVIALGGVGVCLALPRKGVNPQLLGGVLAAVAGGLIMLMLSIRAVREDGPEGLPNIFFYVFAFVALGAALRVITHPRPVYAALYFILTVLATAGLFLILSAEFMAFALIIVYAGAILITYLFVIMLATQAPDEDKEEVLAEYDTVGREPVVATLASFLVLGVLTALLFSGVKALPAPQTVDRSQMLLSQMPRKIERILREQGTLPRGWDLARTTTGDPIVNWTDRTIAVVDPQSQRQTVGIPPELAVKNVEGLGFNLLADHPGTIEIAGVILLMAMLGAVVLSRKQVEFDEDQKMQRARQLAEGAPGSASGGGAGGGGAA